VTHGYLIIVPAAEPALLEYLEKRFKGDPGVSVLVDRRKTPRPSSGAVILFHGVAVARLVTSPTRMTASRPVDRRQTMTEVPSELEDRQRVERWLEESQYLLGRLIPGYLDDRERLKARLTGSEAECERLRGEIDGLRRELACLVAELQHHRNEQAATAEAFAAVLGQLSDLQKPLSEVHRRLQAAQGSPFTGAPLVG
jgi:hypothetical protein